MQTSKNTERRRILRSPAYWISKIQIALYNCAERFMADNSMNRTQLADRLGVSKGYISQLLNGDYDHKISKLVELSLAFGYVPSIEFTPIEQVMQEKKSATKTISLTSRNASPAPAVFIKLPTYEIKTSMRAWEKDDNYKGIHANKERVTA